MQRRYTGEWHMVEEAEELVRDKEECRKELRDIEHSL